jgi:pyrimidine-nucleoside phosphorylase
MSFVESIIRKRDGEALTREEIQDFVVGAGSETLPPEQLAAMLMAICCRGMSDYETRLLTEQMVQSGEVWEIAVARPNAVDKHSTGGVGDTVSLVLAPLLAACGVPVAMMAGRGLSHSQGTLDKLRAIPGFRCDWNREEVLDLMDSCGVAFMAQSERIAPADRTLYALRDITRTVPSLPLIVSSIMSKELALGVGTLILDVKWGRGAFRPNLALARELASALRSVARGMGVTTEALVTDMNQPLGPALGTACEVRAARDVLDAGGGADLRAVSVRLAQEAMVLRGWSAEQARDELEGSLTSGRALAAWDQLVEAHGGEPDPEQWPVPAQEHEIAAIESGWVIGVSADTLGWVAAEVGAGRRIRDEELDHGAGILVHARIGDRVESGQPLATILVGDREIDVDAVEDRFRGSFEIGSDHVPPPRLILGTLDEIAEEGLGPRD